MHYIWVFLTRAWMHLAHLIYWNRRHARFIVMLGGPGAGKRNHGSRLGAALGLPHLDIGDLLRKAPADTAVGRRIHACVSNGRLVPDEIMIALLHRELAKPECRRGAILDGFPRKCGQAALLDRLLLRWGNVVERAIFLEVPETDLTERLLRRQRCDDTPDVIAERLNQFNLAIQPLCDYYRSKGLLSTVVSTNQKTKAEVFAEVRAAVA